MSTESSGQGRALLLYAYFTERTAMPDATVDLNAMSDAEYRNYERRVRRKAARQNLTLVKLRKDVTEGPYMLCEGDLAVAYGLTLDEADSALDD